MKHIGRRKKSVYVGFKFSQMGEHSGYDLVRYHAGYDLFIDCQKDFERLQHFLSSRSLLGRAYSYFVGERLWWVECRCLFLALFHRDLVFHFVYAENTYRFLGVFKWLGFDIACTYHQPNTFFRHHPEYLNGLRRVDKIIVLSEGAGQMMRQLECDKRVHVVPHGVDAEYFCPSADVSRQRIVLMVGNWLRNFAFAAEVFGQLLKRDREVIIHIVASRGNLEYFSPHDRLHLHFNISDDDLLHLYRSSAFLFLPLDSFVANNAVLEAASVGCNVLLATNQEGGPFPSDIIEYIPLEADSTVDHIVERLDHPFGDGSALQQWVSHQFGWKKIGGQIRNVLVDINKD